METKKTGAELIAEERREQIEKHGRTIVYDINNNPFGQLRYGAIYLMQSSWVARANKIPEAWDRGIWLKMCEKSYVERLTIAGALIAAEIDRILTLNEIRKDFSLEQDA